MQTSSQIQLLPAVTDNATFYLVMQPKTAGLTNSMLVSPTLTFNPSSNSFQLNGVSIACLEENLSSTEMTGIAGNNLFSCVIVFWIKEVAWVGEPSVLSGYPININDTSFLFT